jgi:hypothetical protein
MTVRVPAAEPEHHPGHAFSGIVRGQAPPAGAPSTRGSAGSAGVAVGYRPEKQA